MQENENYNFERTISAMEGMRAAFSVYASSPDAWEIVNRLLATLDVGPGPDRNNGSLSQHVAVGLRNFFENKPLPSREGN